MRLGTSKIDLNLNFWLIKGETSIVVLIVLCFGVEFCAVCILCTFFIYLVKFIGQVSLTATVTCNQYYLLTCGADGAR